MTGFIWQQTARNLLPYLTALQNIDLADEVLHLEDGKIAPQA